MKRVFSLEYRTQYVLNGAIDKHLKIEKTMKAFYYLQTSLGTYTMDESQNKRTYGENKRTLMFYSVFKLIFVKIAPFKTYWWAGIER